MSHCAVNRQILFGGDPHGRFTHLVCAAERLQPQAVVLLGDMEFKRAAHLELAPIRDRTFFIHGNHDTDSLESWTNLMDSELAVRCIHGRVTVLLDGTRLAGLGGVFREGIWTPPSPAAYSSYAAWLESLQAGWKKRDTMHGRARLRHQSSIFPDVYDRLAAESADVLVTHEAPFPHPYGWRAINELAEALGVSQIVHGHQHDNLNYGPHFARLGYQIFGVGLRGITGRDGQVILPGEMDDVRGGLRLLEPWPCNVPCAVGTAQIFNERQK